MARKVKTSKAKSSATRAVKRSKRVPAKKAGTKKPVAKPAITPLKGEPFFLGYTF
jgi:hypothetical protein